MCRRTLGVMCLRRDGLERDGGEVETYLGIKSAKRTDDNSPAIHRWVRMVRWNLKSVKRTAELKRAISVARFTGC